MATASFKRLSPNTRLYNAVGTEMSAKPIDVPTLKIIRQSHNFLGIKNYSDSV